MTQRPPSGNAEAPEHRALAGVPEDMGPDAASVAEMLRIRLLTTAAAMTIFGAILGLHRLPIQKNVQDTIAAVRGYNGCRCGDCQLHYFGFERTRRGCSPPPLEILEPLAAPLLIAGAAMALFANRGQPLLLRVATRVSPVPGSCPSCGYDLKGLTPDGPCPECGHRPTV